MRMVKSRYKLLLKKNDTGTVIIPSISPVKTTLFLPMKEYTTTSATTVLRTRGKKKRRYFSSWTAPFTGPARPCSLKESP